MKLNTTVRRLQGVALYSALFSGTHWCNSCVDTNWLSPHHAGSPWRSPRGGWTATGGRSCSRCNLSGVLVMTVWGSWWCVGVTTLSLSALVEGQHCMHSHRVLTISAPCTPSPFDSSAAAFSTLPTHPGAALETVWCACHEPAHLVLGEVFFHGS